MCQFAEHIVYMSNCVTRKHFDFASLESTEFNVSFRAPTFMLYM